MKHITGIVVALGCLFVSAGCKSTFHLKSSTGQSPDWKEVEILKDYNFSNGIGLAGLNSSDPSLIDTLFPFGRGMDVPSWRLVQWGSRHNLKGVIPIIQNDTVIYANTAKRISFYKLSGTVQVQLEVYSSHEYLSPRMENEGWPHLLLEQKMKNSPKLDCVTKLYYSINARLLYDSIKMDGNDFNPILHTSQIALYLSVQNVNKESPFFGDYFWFGLPLYDYRYRYISEYAAQDLGKDDATKKFIQSVSSNQIFKGSLHDKEWVSISKDIYPLLTAAFLKAQKRGYLKGTTIHDLGIGSVNLGWEVPGTFNSAIQFKNLKLTAFVN